MDRLTIKIPKLKQRVVWNMKPTTRVKQSKKIYSRKNKELIVIIDLEVQFLEVLQQI